MTDIIEFPLFSILTFRSNFGKKLTNNKSGNLDMEEEQVDDKKAVDECVQTKWMVWLRKGLGGGGGEFHK